MQHNESDNAGQQLGELNTSIVVHTLMWIIWQYLPVMLQVTVSQLLLHTDITLQDMVLTDINREIIGL